MCLKQGRGGTGRNIQNWKYGMVIISYERYIVFYEKKSLFFVYSKVIVPKKNDSISTLLN